MIDRKTLGLAAVVGYVYLWAVSWGHALGLALAVAYAVAWYRLSGVGAGMRFAWLAVGWGDAPKMRGSEQIRAVILFVVSLVVLSFAAQIGVQWWVGDPVMGVGAWLVRTGSGVGLHVGAWFALRGTTRQAHGALLREELVLLWSLTERYPELRPYNPSAVYVKSSVDRLDLAEMLAAAHRLLSEESREWMRAQWQTIATRRPPDEVLDVQEQASVVRPCGCESPDPVVLPEAVPEADVPLAQSHGGATMVEAELVDPFREEGALRDRGPAGSSASGGQGGAVEEGISVAAADPELSGVFQSGRSG